MYKYFTYEHIILEWYSSSIVVGYDQWKFTSIVTFGFLNVLMGNSVVRQIFGLRSCQSDIHFLGKISLCPNCCILHFISGFCPKKK